jgi:hypothetical protein
MVKPLKEGVLLQELISHGCRKSLGTAQLHNRQQQQQQQQQQPPMTATHELLCMSQQQPHQAASWT